MSISYLSCALAAHTTRSVSNLARSIDLINTCTCNNYAKICGWMMASRQNLKTVLHTSDDSVHNCLHILCGFEVSLFGRETSFQVPRYDELLLL